MRTLLRTAAFIAALNAFSGPARAEIDCPRNYPSGRTLRYDGGHMYYPNGATLRYEGGHMDYPNGGTMRYEGGHMDYPNGKTMRYESGSMDYPSGRTLRDGSGSMDYPSGRTLRDGSGYLEYENGRSIPDGYMVRLSIPLEPSGTMVVRVGRKTATYELLLKDGSTDIRIVFDDKQNFFCEITGEGALRQSYPFWKVSSHSSLK
ncbi:MAG: hypothetical protein HY921_02110 [Elusimicrobia bacterium]|nr:hypothetical protein [Elusimicrobiota bacterium]